MKIRVLALCLFFTLVSTASWGWIFSLSNRGEELVGIFESIETSGPTDDNVRALEAFARDNANEPYTDEALLALARIYSGRKDYGRAVEACQRVIIDFPGSPLKNDALYELGSVMYRTGRLGDARSVLEPVSSSNSAPAALRARASLLLKEMKTASYGIASAPDSTAIGVLLPLKGDYARFGEEALSGILLAADVFGNGSNGPVEVIVRDVSEPAFVESVVDELSGDERVAALVGPLLSSTAVEAARHAQRKGIPLVTLTQKDGITGSGDFVFRNFLTPSAQAASIAGYAIGAGKRKFAILYPQNNYGIELSRFFEKEVKARGGEVVRAASYAPGATNFGEEIKRLFGIKIEERREGRRVIKQFTPTVEIDALFIPDYFETVGLIAPYIGYYSIKDLQLLGANGWNSQRLVALGGKNVEGAVFVDGFFPASGRPGADEFIRKFNDAYGRPPGVLEAQAYDAALVLMAAIKGNNGLPDREALKGRLVGIKGFRGAGGEMTFDSRGEAVKKLFLLTVKNGRIIEVPEEGTAPPASR
ncbi:MAG: penicillin-binding protein activator [Deltaproteobacteria bacterium]|nr:penicillin-binding protein activator [Deltaproteobacteria bacterium]